MHQLDIDAVLVILCWSDGMLSADTESMAPGAQLLVKINIGA